MAYEIRDNSGSLFKNDKREADNHPNARGKAMIDGTMYYVDAWTKKDKNGNPWQSLSFKRIQGEPAPKSHSTERVIEDDSIPF